MKQKDMANMKKELKNYNIEMSEKLTQIAKIPGIEDLCRYFGYSLKITQKKNDSLDFFPEIKLQQLSYLLGKKSRVYAYLGFDNSQSLDSELSIKQVRKLLKLFGFTLTEKENFIKEYWNVKSYEKEMIYTNTEKGLLCYINTSNGGQKVEFVRIHGQIDEFESKAALNHIEGRKFRIYDGGDVINFRVDCSEPIGFIKLLVLYDQAKLNKTWNGKFEVGKLGGLNLLNDYDKNQILSQNGRYDREVTLDKIYQHDTIRNIVFG